MERGEARVSSHASAGDMYPRTASMVVFGRQSVGTSHDIKVCLENQDDPPQRQKDPTADVPLGSFPTEMSLQFEHECDMSRGAQSSVACSARTH